MSIPQALRRLGLSGLLALPGLSAAQLVVTTPEDVGPGSLREALQAANAHPDLSTIRFDIDRARFGPGPWTIQLATELPEIRTPTRVLGFTQPGSVAGPTPLDGDYRVQIDDSAVADSVDNLGAALAVVRGGEGSEISGLVFLGGRAGKTSVLLAADEAAVVLCRVGVDAARRAEPVAGAAISAIHADRMRVERNLIGGSGSSAIQLTGTGHRISGNWVGYDGYGSSSLANFVAGSGIVGGLIAFNPPPRLLTAYSVAVQQGYLGLRDSTISDNWVSQTQGSAIGLSGSAVGTRGNRVQGNRIGIDLWNGAGAWVDAGVRISSGADNNRVIDNRIGRANAGILLGDNRGATPQLAGERNTLSGNLFTEIAQRSIGLDPARAFAPPANDPGDADSGPNRLQNHPVLSFASSRGGVEGQLDSAAHASYRIDLYSARRCHPSGRDSAEFHLGFGTVQTDAAGRARFVLQAQVLPGGGLRAGDVISATATDADGNTSELSPCLPATAAPTPQVQAPALPSPLPAHGGPRQLAVELRSSLARLPEGRVELRAVSATGEAILGSGLLSAGRLRIDAPLSGFFPFAGRYAIELDYAGDGFHAPLRTSLGDVVVFRPALALESIEASSLVRRDVSSGDYEYLSVASASWIKLPLDSRLPWIDGERIANAAGDPLDRALAGERSQYQVGDGRGGVAAIGSALLGPDVEVLDLVQIDADPRADAVVRDRGTGRYGTVLCVFVSEGCERSGELDVPAEHRYVLSGDFNGDGQQDLVFRDPANGKLLLLFMQFGKPLSVDSLAPLADEQPVAAVDLDGDGYEDLVWLDAPGNSLLVSMMKAGRVVDLVREPLPAGDWTSPGSAHLAKPTDPDYGHGHLLLAERNTGEVIAWREVSVGGGRIRARIDGVLFDPGYAVQRTR
ncbi:FG-GAP-like repeat-containing protein [Aquimonas voraii]|uniref:Repeat domain-containing protein n=1 Tax=Aquimonas voraii TaxID=265719 RepID=A0A1G6SK03_9GAMM|nr:FG-GAP-like repeat-containing protein [Aquimonas voraii]SDD16971.1 Repeat domain-containing protein [Aquimonas voraii]